MMCIFGDDECMEVVKSLVPGRLGFELTQGWLILDQHLWSTAFLMSNHKAWATPRYVSNLICFSLYSATCWALTTASVAFRVAGYAPGFIIMMKDAPYLRMWCTLHHHISFQHVHVILLHLLWGRLQLMNMHDEQILERVLDVLFDSLLFVLTLGRGLVAIAKQWQEKELP